MGRLLLILLLFPVVCAAQIPGKKLKNPFTAKNGITFHEGDTLMLGTGSNDNGEFSYVYQPPNYLGGVEKRNLSPLYANTKSVIKHFKQFKVRKVGKKTIAVINPAGGLNHIVDIEPAIRYGELIGVNGKEFSDPKKANAPVAVNKVQKLKELKGLLDAGAITQEEYDKMKSEIINR